MDNLNNAVCAHQPGKLGAGMMNPHVSVMVKYTVPDRIDATVTLGVMETLKMPNMVNLQPQEMHLSYPRTEFG